MRLNFEGWCLVILLSLAVGRVAAAQSAADSPTLRQAAEGKMLVGAAVMSQHLEDPALSGLIALQFNSLTPENEFKPSSLQRAPGEFQWEAADKIADFAQRHDMKLIGHALVWHSQAPRWLFEDENRQPLPRDKALENMRAHIHAVVGHFKGRVHGWDVVNEAVADRGDYLRDTPALRAIGEDYIAKAFEFAHEADPEAELYYNDYNIETPGKREKTLRLLTSLKAAGVRIDGVGIQGHWRVDYPELQVIEDAINAYAQQDLQVMFTEVDIDVLPRRGAMGADVSAVEREGLNPYVNGLPEDVQQQVAARYREVFELFARHPKTVTRVTFWGTHDGTSWLNNFPVRGRTNHPLLWDRQLQPKPALRSVIDVLSSVPAVQQESQR